MNRLPLGFGVLLLFLASACAGSHETIDEDAGHASLDLGTLLDLSTPCNDMGAGACDGSVDSGSPPLECNSAMNVTPDPCQDLDCAPGEPPRYFWDGRECALWPACTACTGSDCGRLTTLDACTAAHSSCLSVLCEATGGFYRAERAYCGNFVCGRQGPQICDDATSACDCGFGKVFDANLGCMPSSTCDAEDLCLATHGTWREASFDPCGNEIDIPPDGPTCDCGGAPFVFDATLGCTPALIDSCVGPTNEQYCARTGGSWIEGCPQACGDVLPCDCVGCAGCLCGRYESFDPARGGCVRDEICPVRGQPYDQCRDDSECLTGLACCIGGATVQGQCEPARCSPDGFCGPPRP